MFGRVNVKMEFLDNKYYSRISKSLLIDRRRYAS